eukprot:3058343-Alexandrium_andersonii.AAC.1
MSARVSPATVRACTCAPTSAHVLTRMPTLAPTLVRVRACVHVGRHKVIRFCASALPRACTRTGTSNPNYAWRGACCEWLKVHCTSRMAHRFHSAQDTALMA